MAMTAQIDTPGAVSAPAIDPPTLDANTMSNLELQRELFDLYFGQAPDHLGRMRDALGDGPTTGWKESAHALKGTARTLGLLRLAEAALSAEKCAPSAPALTAVENAYVSAVSAAHAYLASKTRAG